MQLCFFCSHNPCVAFCSLFCVSFVLLDWAGLNALKFLETRERRVPDNLERKAALKGGIPVSRLWGSQAKGKAEPPAILWGGLPQ